MGTFRWATLLLLGPLVSTTSNTSFQRSTLTTTSNPYSSSRGRGRNSRPMGELTNSLKTIDVTVCVFSYAVQCMTHGCSLLDVKVPVLVTLSLSFSARRISSLATFVVVGALSLPQSILQTMQRRSSKRAE